MSIIEFVATLVVELQHLLTRPLRREPGADSWERFERDFRAYAARTRVIR